jgi:hypothetical protein
MLVNTGGTHADRKIGLDDKSVDRAVGRGVPA